MSEPAHGPAIVLVNSDRHSGSSLALWHPEMRLPRGGTYRNSVTDWMYERYQRAQTWADGLSYGRRRIRVYNGDCVQGIHDPFAEMITNLPEYQELNAVLCIKEEMRPGDKIVLVRGTPRHDGAEGGSVEMIANLLGAPEHTAGERSRYQAMINVNGVRIHVSHHISTTRSPVSKVTGLMSSLAMINTEYARWGRPLPHILLRAHRHEYDYIHIGGAGQGQAVITTPSWAAKGEYAIKVTPNTIAHIGSVAILIDPDGTWRVEPWFEAIPDDAEVML